MKHWPSAKGQRHHFNSLAMKRKIDSHRTVLTRREFVGLSSAVLCLPLVSNGMSEHAGLEPSQDFLPRSTSHDPWIEIIQSAVEHNVGEASRLASGRPILAVVKNNAYGLGDIPMGPIIAARKEVAGIACVRVAEAIALRNAGVKKPILVMAEVSEEETEELVRHNVTSTVWLDDAPERMARVAKRVKRPVPIQMYIDTGMNREGMPYLRAKEWMSKLCQQSSVDVQGTYTMFVHEHAFDRVQLPRFQNLVSEVQMAGLKLGTLHASATYELFHYPESHLDMVRPGNTIFGNYPREPETKAQADLKTVFRLCARVTRLEQLQIGDSAGFGREFIATRPTWVALLPVGHTDGYPNTAANTCHVLIRGRLYPVIANVNSAHTVIDIGEEKSIEVGDVATLIGPDHPEIDPQSVAAKTGVRFLLMITKFNARLPRYVVPS